MSGCPGGGRWAGRAQRELARQSRAEKRSEKVRLMIIMSEEVCFSRLLTSLADSDNYLEYDGNGQNLRRVGTRNDNEVRPLPRWGRGRREAHLRHEGTDRRAGARCLIRITARRALA